MPFTSTMRDVSATRRSRVWRRAIFWAFLALWAAVAYWQTNKSLPPGSHVDSPWAPITPRDVTFIADITSADAYGRQNASQAIFDEVLGVIRSAHRFIVLDYFLFNSNLGNGSGGQPVFRQLSGELRDALIERRRADPNLQVLFITDPINEVYGGVSSRDLRLLRAAGVQVVVTDLDVLRDSNFIYSSLWRLGIKWWSGGNDHGPTPHEADGGWLPNPLDESADPISFGDWARLLNFKANHRKVVIADDGRDGMVTIVGSANPHDASSPNSNVALKIAGAATLPLLESELQVARFSGWSGQLPAANAQATARSSSAAAPGGGRLKVVTEGGILAELLERIDSSQRGDNIDIAMFYLADRAVIESLLEASRRGVAVRVILDPNKDAFGHTKTGIPNQPVASELVAKSDGAIHVRWYRTHGEQFHTKLALIYNADHFWLTAGSANFTRRNIADYNLEANLVIELPRATAVAQQTVDYFETLWGNRAQLGIEYTADFGYFADPSQFHYWVYRVMEGTGASTF
jgi:phosphatidylserine/phosphatidylglycerophosphate/cardiolipin synthase-like enzyme